MTNFVLTKSSGPKSHAVAFTALIFAGFCVCHTGLSGGGGEKDLAYTYQGGPRQDLPLATYASHPPPRAIRAVLYTYQGGQRQDLPAGQSKHLRQIKGG